jgi:hypothetical protein
MQLCVLLLLLLLLLLPLLPLMSILLLANTLPPSRTLRPLDTDQIPAQALHEPF